MGRIGQPDIFQFSTVVAAFLPLLIGCEAFEDVTDRNSTWAGVEKQHRILLIKVRHFRISEDSHVLGADDFGVDGRAFAIHFLRDTRPLNYQDNI